MNCHFCFVSQNCFRLIDNANMVNIFRISNFHI
nr:MAG TPA: hypothetical protein [Caudoviricetes sp.]